MTTKDYVYLSFLALTAVIFYWVGFYGGFNTTLKVLQSREDEELETESLPQMDSDIEPLEIGDSLMNSNSDGIGLGSRRTTLRGSRGSSVHLKNPDQDFGLN